MLYCDISSVNRRIGVHSMLQPIPSELVMVAENNKFWQLECEIDLSMSLEDLYQTVDLCAA